VVDALEKIWEAVHGKTKKKKMSDNMFKRARTDFT